ncbi:MULTISPECIES: DNA polymerase I [unclassified Rathayibacter]|uniref:DNA polymerase I n=1 Tax=unclassified Rathayibacter TaxID=2609250 RepID=UPI00188B5647|nr:MULTISPECIES: DNA polymerase I [unclassified Rathayibacter]MBF4462402.1 DNA polymerase I [Rathayibacter sp. VKM Ac-2879]MBF4503555.1 DNA polymerase I [Rathayibacter sp. VKM Ac-2878]
MSDPEQPTLLLVDGHSLAFRAFYALPVDSFQTRDGQHTNAIHGFLSMLILLLKNEKPTHLGVAFDISRFSFRTREYPEYKGTRGETPPEFKGQVPLLEEALHAMNIRTVSKEDFEADDILATLARQGAEAGFRVLVVSGDRDTIQLVTPDVTLLYPSTQGVSQLTRYDRDKVVEKYGVEPHQYPEIAALVGETSDNLPGVDKVGPKTAAKWVNQYGTVAEIIAHADEITGVVGEKLREQKENALRNRRLNRLITDVELPLGPRDLARRPIDPDAVREIFSRLEFKTLQERVLTIAADEGVEGAAAALAGDVVTTAAPAVRTLVDEELAHWLDRVSARGTSPVAVQVQLGDEGLEGLGLSVEKESAFVPWAAERPDYTALERWLASEAPKYFADAKPQIKALRRAGLPVAGLAFDSRVASWLLQPTGHPATLAAQVAQHLDETMAQGDPNQLVPATEPVSPAAEAWYAFRLVGTLTERLGEGMLSVLVDIELPIVQVLATMEMSGVAIDAEVLARLRVELTATADELAARAFAEIGHEMNLGSPKQLQQVLFGELEMPRTRATKTGYTTDASALADLQESHPHPFLGLLLEHRDATKLRQIIETLEKSVTDDGRIHTSYDQTGTATGRISSNDPNLQNIPVRSEVGRRIRTAFVHGEAASTLLTADYSQIEMRIMAHLSGDAGLIEAFHSGEDLHRFVGSRIFGVAPADVSSAMRNKVKAMSYGLAYGLSAFGLSKQLRISSAEAKQLMTDYFVRFGAVRDYLRSVVEQARETGYTETIFGRRRPFPELQSANRVLRDNAERAALNSPIQGSAADIMKRAMIGVQSDLDERALASRMLLQVHDELIFDVAPGEEEVLESIVRGRMAGAADLSVPLEVQLGHGANWDAAAH